MSAPLDVLRQVPLFAGLDDEDLGRLANQMKERRFSEGNPMTSEGRGGAGFFVITEGNATVSVAGEPKATLGAGDYFGEIALIADSPRTATITAETPLLALGLTSWEFRPIVETNASIAWKMLETLARMFGESQRAATGPQ
jgi:CRP/FNR family transcriptional regulator, cyclic AMP receptor protein